MSSRITRITPTVVNSSRPSMPSNAAAKSANWPPGPVT
jgi:hypothetical protein